MLRSSSWLRVWLHIYTIAGFDESDYWKIELSQGVSLAGDVSHIRVILFSSFYFHVGQIQLYLFNPKYTAPYHSPRISLSPNCMWIAWHNERVRSWDGYRLCCPPWIHWRSWPPQDLVMRYIHPLGNVSPGGPTCDWIVFDPPPFETACEKPPVVLQCKYLNEVAKTALTLSEEDVLVLILAGHKNLEVCSRLAMMRTAMFANWQRLSWRSPWAIRKLLSGLSAQPVILEHGKAQIWEAAGSPSIVSRDWKLAVEHKPHHQLGPEL